MSFNVLEERNMGHHLLEPVTQNDFYRSIVMRVSSLELGLVLSVTTDAILGKLLNHSVPQFFSAEPRCFVDSS